MSKLLKWILIILFPVGIWFSWNYFTRPISISNSTSKIVINDDPYQSPLAHQEDIVLKVDDNKVFLTPIAEYDISAQVVSRKNYYFSFEADIISTDLALAWGKLADKNYNQDISYSQGNRWYYYHFGPNAKLDGKYISSHSSNHHIVPASENIKKAVKRIKKNQLLHIEGYLVNIKATNGEINFRSKTSTTRLDSGAGACEIVYVTKIQISNLIYQ